MPIDPRGREEERYDFGSDIITLSVGTEGYKIAVHENLLRASSPFFSTSLKDQWVEGKGKLIQLPDDDITIVNIHIQWLYRNKIYTRKPSEHLSKTSDELDTLIEAYIYGEKIHDLNFKDAVIDSMIACWNTKDVTGCIYSPIAHRVDRAYEGTASGSHLRRLLVDNHARRGHSGWIEDTQNPEFLKALAQALFDREPSTKYSPLDGTGSSCMYHHHGDDEECYSRTISQQDTQKITIKH